MAFRIYVEKKPGLAHEADKLLDDARNLLGITSLIKVRVINRYDAEKITDDLFGYAIKTVFSEPQLDTVSYELDADGAICFAVEYLPGQFDLRADSAAQCIQFISRGERPLIRTAKVYLLYGDLTDDEIAKIKKYVINPVEAREASLELSDTLDTQFEIPTTVDTLDEFSGLNLAMDDEDIEACREYFKAENRKPTITEIRVIDTYWSDHCRHKTFKTIIDDVTFEDALIEDTYKEYLKMREDLGRAEEPICLMDIATIAMRALKEQGKLDKLDESEEINACTVRINVDVDGKSEPWLLLFKNETHNHPTEIEPFGGAATCIGGAIRDPLSGRGYVYAAMRVTGSADPLQPIDETIEGRLPQRKIAETSAAGSSSYSNQIGLATGLVDEIYHKGYAAKHMEISATIAATPVDNVRREEPVLGDVIILLGGATGRDGCGGATGSSKPHTASSLDTCGPEAQKGNAPEERKLQRFFRNKSASQLIKRCNDVGAGGITVAIGELASGLEINLDALPKKYEGLDGTELAISESQERMVVVIAASDVDAFLSIADAENLSATPVAVVTEEPRLKMNWNGKTIVDISREFLDTNGVDKHIVINTGKASIKEPEIGDSFTENYKALAGDLNVCSKRGLSENFDSTAGTGTVLMPFGGKNQLTPIQAMAHKISTEKKDTDDCSIMSYGYNPFIAEQSPYHGAYFAALESVSKLIATGADYKDIYLSFQEYFGRPGTDGKRWGQPLAAILGAYKAQMQLGIAAIGGKDSMNGTFEDIDVPPTLVSFAVTTSKTGRVVSPEFKRAGDKVIFLSPSYDENGLPETDSLISLYGNVSELLKSGKAVACYTPGIGGIAAAILKMCIGNGFGFAYSDNLSLKGIFGYNYGGFVLEVDDWDNEEDVIGIITEKDEISFRSDALSLSLLLEIYEDKLESVYSCNIEHEGDAPATLSYDNKNFATPAIRVAKPQVLIPVFPGTNCEYDSAKAVEAAGAEAKIVVVNNLSADGIARSMEQFVDEARASQMIFIPGGFSGGDEPDGNGKFITAFFRNPEVKEAVSDLLDNRDGLMCGICNGFQALIKLGLVPYGKIIDTDENCPTLARNTISRHQSKIVRTRIVSNKSPWLSLMNVGDIVNVPISHGEGRFFASDELIKQLAENGQIATQYVDLDGNATNDVRFNPNNSMCGVEGITSPDGRVFGKMGHSERIGSGLYKNVPGNYDIRMFESAVKYFK